MIARVSYRLAWMGLLALVLVSTVVALAAANNVRESGVDEYTSPITANALKPPACAGLNLSGIIVGRGKINGGNGNSLILASSDADSVKAGQGADCILGGGGNDDIDGQKGNDVILGGPGDDVLKGGPGTDVCYGGAGVDTFDDSCETQIQ